MMKNRLLIPGKYKTIKEKILLEFGIHSQK